MLLDQACDVVNVLTANFPYYMLSLPDSAATRTLFVSVAANATAQDGIKLAQELAAAGGLAAPPAAMAAALRSYERERSARAAPVTKRSRYMGAALQMENPWVSARTSPVGLWRQC